MANAIVKVGRNLTLKVVASVQHVGGHSDLKWTLHFRRQRLIDVPVLQQPISLVPLLSADVVDGDVSAPED